MIFSIGISTICNAQGKKHTLNPRPIKKTLLDSIVIVSKDTTVFLVDTIEENQNKNSSAFYKNLKKNASKNKFTKKLFQLLFRANPNKHNKKPDNIQQSDLPFQAYNGKIIRNIIVKVFKPFGPSITDTLRLPSNWLERTANTLHNTSRRRSILKAIHLKKGDKIDACDLADNERLLRNLDYVQNACIKVKSVKENKNEVDIYLWVKDKFSWGGNINFGSFSKTTVEIYSHNLYGAGHQFETKFIFDNKKEQKLGNYSSYTIPHIFNTYINAKLQDSYTYKEHYTTVSLTKLFETYKTKTAGGITLNKTFRSKTLTNIDPIDNEYFLKFDHWSAWYAYSFPLKSSRKFARRKFFIAGKVQRYHFYDRPETNALKNKFFHDNTLFLTAFSLNQTQFYKSNLIYNFGRTEDVPYGFLAQLNVGYEKGEFRNRFYTAFDFEIACRVKKTRSYLYNHIALGSFFNKDGFEQGTFIAESKFISRIRELGRFKFRNFGSIKYVRGINRFPEEFITLNQENDIRGFDSKQTRGTRKLTLSLETVAFTPYQWLGFQFAFLGFIDGGVIKGYNYSKPNYYYAIGLGTRIHNPHLVFKTLQIRFAFYPKIPADFHHMGFRVAGEKRPQLDNFNVQEPKIISYQ